jgi:hypothetical protein
MANPLRGEVELPLRERKLLLRPSFSALVAAEAETGSLFRLLDRAAAGEVCLADMGALFRHCAGVLADERGAFEAALLEAGPAELLGPYRALLTAIFGRV